MQFRERGITYLRSWIIKSAGEPLKVPAGTLIVFLPPWVSAAMMAERSEICPVESWPVLRFVATESTVVFTVKVAGASRSSSDSSLGRDPPPFLPFRQLSGTLVRIEAKKTSSISPKVRGGVSRQGGFSR